MQERERGESVCVFSRIELESNHSRARATDIAKERQSYSSRKEFWSYRKELKLKAKKTRYRTDLHS